MVSSMNRFFPLVSIIFFSSCVPPVFPEDNLPPYEERPIYGLFNAGFDRVWSAAIEAMDLYPLEIVDKERGLIVTEWITSTSDYIFSTFGATYIPEKIRFKMRLHINSRGGKTTVKIISWEQVEKDLISGNLEFTGSIYTWIDVPSSTAREREVLEKIRKNLTGGIDLDFTY